MSTSATGDTIKFKRLSAAVWDKNKTSDELLGKGDVGLRKLGVNLGNDVTLQIPLKNTEGLPAGYVNVVAVIMDTTKLIKELKAPDGSVLTHGFLEIKKIKMSNIRNTGM